MSIKEIELPLPEDAIVIISDGSLVRVDVNTGEVLGFEDAPPENMAMDEVVGWFAGKFNLLNGKKSGLETEREYHLDRINTQYDPDIKRLDNSIKWLVASYENMCRGYAKNALMGKGKTVKVQGVKFSFRAAQPKTEILDQSKAVAFMMRIGVPEAVKTVTTVLTSLIPEEVKVRLDGTRKKIRLDGQAISVNPEETGIKFTPAGEDTFSIK